MCRHKRLRSLLSGKRVNGSQQRYNGLTEERLCLIWCVLVGHLDLTWSLCFSVCEVDLWSRSKDQLSYQPCFWAVGGNPKYPERNLHPDPWLGFKQSQHCTIAAGKILDGCAGGSTSSGSGSDSLTNHQSIVHPKCQMHFNPADW